MTKMSVSLQEIEMLVNNGYTPKINTPTGYEDITEVFRKKSKGFHLFFSDGTEFKAASQHRISVDGKWMEVDEIEVDAKINEKTLVKKLEVQEQEWIDFTVNATHHSYIYNGMVHHNSGKSYIIHLIQQHYHRAFELKTLVVVDRIGLVHQMAGDFISYGVPDADIHRIISGKEKNSKTSSIYISTWQSIVNMPKEWFAQFGLFIGDEAHTYAAKSLISIMEKMPHCKYKFGFTGTISSKSPVNKLTLEGLFGRAKKIVSTKDLIADGTIAEFDIKGIVLKHDKETRQKFKKETKELVEKNDKEKGKKASLKYQFEIDFLNNCEKRNIFIRNLLWSLKDSNNLVLFDRIEKHGAILEKMFQKEGRMLHFIHGGVKGEERERIRNLIENDNRENITIHFNEKSIEVDESEIIPLTDGKTVIASELTEKHDVSEHWINLRLFEKTNK
jgi:hypothetical protein